MDMSKITFIGEWGRNITFHTLKIILYFNNPSPSPKYKLNIKTAGHFLFQIKSYTKMLFQIKVNTLIKYFI